MTEKILIHKENSILTLTFNRPQVRNAVDPETMNALRGALQSAATDASLRVVVLTGAGGAFCAGADIQSALQNQNGNIADLSYNTLTESYGPTLMAIRDCPLPVIAAIDGYAAGIGCDLALRCDLRLMSQRGVLAELFIRVGLIPDGGGTYLLPRLLGLGRAMEWMFSGRDIPAEEALELGLANQVLPAENFMEHVYTFAGELAKRSPKALERGKRAMLAAIEGGSYADALQREAELQREIFGSEDGLEGFMAFMEKREPQWKGR